MSQLPARRRESPDVRREQILDAAEAVLLDRGLAATTMADVANAAAIAKGTTYLYFRSKSELLAGLRARYLERFAEALTSARSHRSANTASHQLDRFVRALFEFSVANSRLHHLLFQEAGFSEEDAFSSLRNLLSGILETGAAAGEFDVSDVETTTDFLVQGLHGVLVHHMHSTPPRRGVVGYAAELARRAVGSMPYR